LNILIITQYFYPENFRINDFAIELRKKGHNISVLTSIPNYPFGKYYTGYGLFSKRRSVHNKIKIYRCPVIPRRNGTAFWLSLNYLSYVFSGLLSSIFLLKNKIDLIYVYQGSPITVAFPAIFIKKIKKIPICISVVDLWPESVSSASNLKSDFIPKLLIPIVKYIYSNCDLILVSSRGFINSILNKGISDHKIKFLPQWAESIFKPIQQGKYQLESVPTNSFKIMFAGNVGEAQDFASIIETAKLLKNNEAIHWLIIGSGRKVEWVKMEIKKHKLEKCFHMLGSFPLEEMPAMYAHADCMFFSLKNKLIFSQTVPGKVQSYLASSKPILAMVNGEAGKIIKDSNSGLVCSSGDYNKLVENINILARMKKKELNILGVNGLRYYNKFFKKDVLINKAEKYLLSLINE
jgi:colanic acid biosynthesis glycosyl transferase WcaI